MKPAAFSLAFLMLVSSGADSQDILRDNRFSPSSITFDRSFLSDFPARNLRSIITRAPGLTEVNGNLHGRGNRSGQVEYLLDGFTVLDRYTNDTWFPFIPEAMEEVSVTTGSYGALLGASGGGLVQMRMKRGGDQFAVHAGYVTDDVANPGEPFLDTYSYGFNTVVLTAEGPLPFNTRFFIAGEVRRERDRRPMYLEPMEYEFVQAALGSYPAGMQLPYPFITQRNHVPSHWSRKKTIQGNLQLTLFEIGIELLGSSNNSLMPSTD